MLRRSFSEIACKRYYSDKHSFQKTLILPSTKFPNRSNLQKTFNQLIPESSQDVYASQLNGFLSKIRNMHDDAAKVEFIKEKLFVLHDGPPYANGDLHLGHALNKILKDIINRYQLIRGKYVFYKPGWDCHGLPIEMKALKDFNNESSHSIAPLKVRSMAASHATKAIQAQKKQFKQFAILTDWNDCYKTMDPEYEINQLEVFLEMLKKGLIKRQNRPVFWGIETRTALAEGELEYNDNHKSTAVFVKFPLTSASNLQLLEKLSKNVMVEYLADKERNDTINCLIWTSTPWTLFSNQAICFNEKFTYCLVKLESDFLIVEEQLLQKLNVTEPYEILEIFSGELLAGLHYTHPSMRDGVPRPLLHGEHVTKSVGTGLVHTAPGHGSDDYLIGLQNNLNIFSPVDHTGRYKLDELPSYVHKTLTEPETGLPRKVLDHATTSAILECLKSHNMLHAAHEYIHSYPYDWRSKKPVIIRATPQWFADLHDVKKLALDSLKDVKFSPARGQARLGAFIRARNEWCISRQRSWGVPIPALFKVDEPDQILMTEETVSHIIDVIKKKGMNSWFAERESDMREWLPPSFAEEANAYARGRDTMDVWFDSGSSWSVLERFYLDCLKLEKIPEKLADVYLEGSDQHRGWFQSSLLTKVASSGAAVAPYKNLITHGFTLDEKGIKMSKSIGNTISPKHVIEGDQKTGLPALGVDGLRYLMAQADYTTDIVAGPTVMVRVADALKKLRLTLRFLLGNLNVGYTTVQLSFDDLRPVDQYTLSKLQELMNTTEQHYENFNFSKVLTTVQHHMTNQLSAFYFDISKDTLYCDAKDSKKRQQILTTLFHILDTYRAIMAPILPVMMQEVWNCLPSGVKESETDNNSPINRAWPQFPFSSEMIKNFEKNELVVLREYQKQFKQLNSDMTKSSQTTVTIVTDAQDLPFDADEISDILQTARTDIILSAALNTVGEDALMLSNGVKIKIEVKPSTLMKCPRCWKHNISNEEKLCDRCEQVVHTL
ncbi:hypothetical protein HG537_0G01490 [Torulaspora globosa]|uniref:Isoleucine--tRNA ligase, mitochondrial n=1 Tax=Torulaspora globosa TaxID=48254 RepID=A0A7H9HZ89_9SACH|nr:hypothetical protein HG537_0G01490 [Torulaspora sp. CBS 2947]